MALTLQQKWDMAHGPTQFDAQADQVRVDATHFSQRVSMAALSQAVTVSEEPTTTANHVKRLALASQVFHDFVTMIPALTRAAVTIGLSQASSDAEIIAAAAASWDFLAGTS